MNFFVGRNNSGKSNFFKALKFLKLLIGKGVAESSALVKELKLKSLKDITNEEQLRLELEIHAVFRSADDKLKYMDYSLSAVVNGGLQVKSESLKRRISARRGNMAELLDHSTIEYEQLPLFSLREEKLPESDLSGSVLNLISRISESEGEAYDSVAKKSKEFGADPYRLALTMLQDSKRFNEIRTFADYILRWRFFEIDLNAIRQPSGGSLSELEESCANLSPVLFKLQKEQSTKFVSIERRLKKLFPEIDRIAVHPTADGEFYLVVREVGGNRDLPAWLLSDGVLRFLTILTILETAEQYSLVCIDEPESGIFPGAQEYLGQILKGVSKNSQVFMLTHSPFLLQSYDSPSAKSIVFIERSKEGGSSFTPFDARKDLQKALQEQLTWADVMQGNMIGSD